MIICKENGMIEVSGSPDEILRECSAVFASLVFVASEETGVSLVSCFEKMFDIMEHYIKIGIAERFKNNSGIKSCSDCDAYDGEREGCTMPSCDMDYACHQSKLNQINGGFYGKN